MKKYQIAYFGTPYFSANFLEKMLLDKELPIEIIFVVTQPDKPVGRYRQITPSPVKQIAKKYGIKIFEFNNFKIGNSLKIENFKLKIKKCDFAFLFAYGSIISKDLLNQPRLGFLNTHPSLLPKYRGPSPMAYPLILGDTQTGVTLIRLDEDIDHGPIIMQEKLEILPNDRRPDLEIKLTNLVFEMFLKLINSSTREPFNRLIFSEQNHAKATFTRMLEKKDGFIPFPTLQRSLKNEPLTMEELPSVIKEYIIKNSKSQAPNIKQFQKSKYENSKLFGIWNLKLVNSAKIIYDFFRGLYPWPGIWTTVIIKGNKKRLKITDLKFSEPSNLPTFQPSRLEIMKVQLEGKNEVDFKTFNKAYKIF